eukprot:TRINITY_DN4075_c0_g1_i1.p1 TRINITY_DN4075_c0_g1~~TRINITY_DN4075_c0_g1_i1.p1  ORF type:complete len:171 (+),score=20.14 TRINITY_DN4075_c0_g1_i1:372-884(+)
MHTLRRYQDCDTILGQLVAPLSVVIKDDEGRFEVKPSTVLVIDRLPVPFHLSVKKLHGNRRPCVAAQLINGYLEGDLKEKFPVEYLDHPYWTSNKRYVGDGFDNPTDFRAVDAGTTVVTTTCAKCSRTTTVEGGQSKLCGRCKSTYYCCREHQKQHWRQHRSLCSPIAQC